MRKLNIFLAILIVGVLLAPSAAFGKVAEACCGVIPTTLVADDRPDPACEDEAVTISGTYSAIRGWSGETFNYDTGIEIRVYDSGLNEVASYNATIAGNVTDPGPQPAADNYTFSWDWLGGAAGTYVYEVVVWTDAAGREEIDVIGQTITVEDCNEAPDCSGAEPSISTIWPPNHKFVDINILGVTDPDGDPVTIIITSIRQDEHLDTLGDGSHEPDGTGVGTDTASVRAERSGTKKVPGDGRVYHISFVASDGKGGFCRGEVQVGVPHDVKDIPVDGGPVFDSTGG